MGSQLYSAMQDGFVFKTSSRLVQKLGKKKGKENYKKGAYKTKQTQRGQGKKLFFQGMVGEGFAKNLFPSEDTVKKHLFYILFTLMSLLLLTAISTVYFVSFFFVVITAAEPNPL